MLPLTIELSNTGHIPLLFASFHGIGQAIGIWIYLKIYHSDYMIDAKIKEIREAAKEKPANLNQKTHINKFWSRYVYEITFISRSSIVFYVWSTQYIDTAVAAMIYSTSTIWFVAVRYRKQEQRENRSLSLGKKTFALLSLAVLGLWFIRASEDGVISIPALFNKGVLIALLAAALNGLNWAGSHEIGEKVKNSAVSKMRKGDVELASNLLSIAYFSSIVGIICFFLSLFFNFALGNVQSISTSVLFVLPYSLIFHPINLVNRRKANNSAKSLEINSVIYLIPLFGIAFLFLASFFNIIDSPNVRRFDFLLIGAVGIIAINFILNSGYQARQHKTEHGTNIITRRIGLDWLILSLWITGIVALYRDRWLGSVDWLWSGKTDYFALLGLSTTVFILILSFRGLRIIERTSKEEEAILSIFRKIQMHLGNSEKALESLCQIDTARPGENLSKQKSKIESAITQMAGMLSPLDSAEMHKDLDMLELSKAKDRDIIEPMVLSIFALVTVLLSLFTRPDFTIDYSIFVIDLFSIIFSSTIAFLAITLFDLRRERTTPRIESILNSPSQIMDDSEPEGIWVHLYMPLTLLGIMVISFTILIFGKWYGEWGWVCDLFSETEQPPHCTAR